MPLRVIQNVWAWLPQTQTWIHTQVDCVPRGRIENHVVCENSVSLDQFPVEHLHDFSKLAWGARFWDRAMRKLKLRRHLGYLPRVARAVRAEIIHSHFGDVAWKAINAARAADCRHVATFYGYDMSMLPGEPLWRERFRELFTSAHLFLCEGPHMASRIVALGCPEEKVRVHHLGVRLENLPYRLRRWNGSEPLQFLIASTFAEKKGITYALEALGRVSRELDFQLTIIGDSNGYQNNNIEKKRILEAIDRHGFGSRVRMLGYQPHRRMIEEAYRSHVFMAPSVTTSDGGTEGGAPVAVIEMAATGMPVIASRHCDIPNVILEGRTGWLADERDVAGLADCIRGVASAPSDWERVTMAGRRYIEKEFDAVVQGQRTADIYEGVVGV